MPKIPAMPDKTGGAGIGNFNNENINPTIYTCDYRNYNFEHVSSPS